MGGNFSFLTLEADCHCPLPERPCEGICYPPANAVSHLRITRVTQANKVNLYSTLTAQQLRSDGNRSNQELTANELPADRQITAGPPRVLGAHGSAVGSGDHERRLRAAHEQGQAEARLGGSALC